MKMFILNIRFYPDLDTDEVKWEQSIPYMLRTSAVAAISTFLKPYYDNNEDEAYNIEFNAIEGVAYIAIENYDDTGRIGMWVLSIDEAQSFIRFV